MMVFLNKVLVGEKDERLDLDGLGGLQVVDEACRFLLSDAVGQFIDICALKVFLLAGFDCLFALSLHKDHLIRGHFQLRLAFALQIYLFL